MTTYRTGNHHGITIVRESEAPSASGYVCDGCGDQAEVWIDDRPLCRREPEVRADAQLVAVVVNGDQALAERICALLNGAHTPDVDHTRGAAEALALTADRIADLGHSLRPGTHQRLREILEGVAAELGVDGDAPSRPLSAPVAAQESQVGGSGRPEAQRRSQAAGYAPPPSVGPGCICNDPPPTVDKPKNGTPSRPPGWACPRHGAVI